MRIQLNFFYFLFLFFFLPLIKTLEAQEVNVNDSSFLKATYNYLLMVEADSGHKDKVRDLLYVGADPNTTDDYGVTPLMFAVQSGNYDLVEFLIERGANVNAYPHNGNTALHAAVQAANDSIAELLLGHQADVNAKNIRGLIPLHFAAWQGLPYLTDLLIFYGADVNSRDYKGNTPLMLSVYSGAKVTARLLLENGANPNLSDKNGVTPLMVAAQFNDTLLCSSLLCYGADYTLTDNRDANALCYAIVNNSNDVLKVLVNFGAHNSNLERTYYQIAYESRNRQAQEIFKNEGLSIRLKPSLATIYGEFGLAFSSHEYLNVYSFGIREQLTQLDFSLGFFHRPKAIATLTEINSQLYQFWEYRKGLQIELQKKFSLTRYGRWQLNSFAGFLYGIAFRNFRGTQNDPNKVAIPKFCGGFTLMGKVMEYKVGVDYSFYKQYGVSPYIFTISARFHINTLSPRVVNKTIIHVN